MKGKFALPVCLLLALHLLFVALNDPASAAPMLQPGLTGSEPNNTFGTAAAINLDDMVEETIAPSGDADWFALTVDHQGELQVALSNVPEELALSLRVWNANRDVVSDWFSPLAAGGDTLAVVDLASPGRYFLEVANDDSSVESTQPYELQATFTATADSSEPNNSFGSAAPLAFDQMHQANILPAGESDWYSLDVAEHGELSVEIGNVANDLALYFRLWDTNRDTLSDWFSPLAQGGNTSGSLDLPEAGTYYLEVTADSGQRSTQPYTLELAFVAAADGNEPNDSFGTAAPLGFGEATPANILPARDTDWYQIAIDQHGELSLAITDVPSALAIRVRVWNSNKDTISDWISPLSAGGETIGSIDLPAPGNYYLEVIEAAGERSVEPFTVTATFIPAPDPFENNDTFGAASTLGLDQDAQTNILPVGETDWHMLALTHQGELQITASDVPADMDVTFRVWNSNKDVISNWFAPLARGGNTTGIVDIPVAGSYFVEVIDGSYDARSVEPFALSSRFIPAADQGEPNNTLETATPVELDITIPANILPANDADWCLLEIDEIGELHVLITNVAPELELAFRLWNEQEEVVFDWVYPLAAGGNTTAVFPIAEPGAYFLEVVDNRGERSIQPYLLRFSMEEIDPASMAFTQIVTDTDKMTDTVTSVEAGTVTITTTTTTEIITTTIESSGELSETEITTATETLTTTSVVTNLATPSTPIAPPPPSSTGAAPVAPSTSITATVPSTSTEESTATPAITPSLEITSTLSPTDTGSLPAPASTLPALTTLPATIYEGGVVTVEGNAVVVAVQKTFGNRTINRRYVFINNGEGES